MKLSEYQKSRSFFDLGQRSLKISKLKLVFHRNSWAIWNQSLYESLRENENENLYKELGHMTIAAMPIYGKNLKKSSSPEPIDQ